MSKYIDKMVLFKEVGFYSHTTIHLFFVKI